MTLTPARRAVLLALPALAAAPRAHAADFTHKAWRIDAGAVPTPGPDLARSLRAQFDIVDSLEERIDPDAFAFFRALPLRLVAESSGGGGDYQFGSGRVNLAAKLDPPENPVLLHEMLHAYHDLKLGRFNPRLRELYAATVAGRAFPADAYMLKNPAEFFAMCASVAPLGSRRPPAADARRPEGQGARGLCLDRRAVRLQGVRPSESPLWLTRERPRIALFSGGPRASG